MNEPLLVLGALVFAGGSIIAWIKFWMDIGAMRQKAESAQAQAISAHAQAEILKTDIQQFKERVALEVMPKSFQAHEARIAAMFDGLRSDIGELRKDVREVNSRIDQIIKD